MASSSDSNSNEASLDAYSALGLKPGASFEDVQKAKQKRLEEIGQDPIAKAKVEASYDAVLMSSLRERQLGKVSNEAVDASQRESGQKIDISLLSWVGKAKKSINSSSDSRLLPDFSIAEGQDLLFRLALGFLAIVLILVSPEMTGLVLSLSTIALLTSQVKRGRRFFSSLGWSVVVLSLGLILGGIVSSGGSYEYLANISEVQVRALPAVILLWISNIFLA